MLAARSLVIATALTLLAAPALAIPVTHTINGSLSNLSADLDATLSINANTNLGNQSGSASASGTLSSTPQGAIELDWGAPSWSGQADIAAGGADIQNPNPGSASGNATIDLFGFIPLNFNLNINIDTIDLNLASAFSGTTAPTPGPGPFVTGDIVDIELSAQIDFAAAGSFGINIGQNDLMIGPSVVTAIPLVGALSRTGGFPGTGTSLNVTLPGLTISLPPQPTNTINTPGCEFGPLPFNGCTLNVSSVDVTLTSLTLSNITGTIVAESTTAIIPEPAGLALVASGLLGLVLRKRRA